MPLQSYNTISPVPVYPKYVSEDLPLTINFSDDLNAGETITSLDSITASVLVGTDLNPQNILSGSPTVATPNIVQMITGGVAGTQYQVSVTVTTSIGAVRTGKTSFWVVAG